MDKEDGAFETFMYAVWISLGIGIMLFCFIVSAVCEVARRIVDSLAGG